MKILKGKKALITGGSSGIGKAIAICFFANGADVAIFGTNEAKAKEAIEEIKKHKVDDQQKILYKTVDVSQTKLVEEAIEEVYKNFQENSSQENSSQKKSFQEIDILVNNAGIAKDNFIIKMTEEDWDNVLEVNLKSVFNTSKIVVRRMMKAKKGKIINISSVVGLMGNSSQTNYVASKAGMIGFSKALAKELGRKGICVNCIAPGFIKTKMTANLPAQVIEKMKSNISLNRLGLPEEIAQAALFLASNMSDYITGQVLTVDGGMYM